MVLKRYRRNGESASGGACQFFGSHDGVALLEDTLLCFTF